jgi:hypothetical protein
LQRHGAIALAMEIAPDVPAGAGRSDIAASLIGDPDMSVVWDIAVADVHPETDNGEVESAAIAIRRDGSGEDRAITFDDNIRSRAERMWIAEPEIADEDEIAHAGRGMITAT